MPNANGWGEQPKTDSLKTVERAVKPVLQLASRLTQHMTAYVFVGLARGAEPTAAACQLGGGLPGPPNTQQNKE